MKTIYTDGRVFTGDGPLQEAFIVADGCFTAVGSNADMFALASQDDRLVSVLDLITGYPEKDDAFIGWFMVDGHLQRQGIGSQIFADVRAAMTGQGYDYLSLSCEKENTEAIAFWQAQGFRAAAETDTCIEFSRDI